MFSQSFYKIISLSSLVMAICIGSLDYFNDSFSISLLIWPSLLYLYLLSCLIYFVSNSGLKKDNKTFLTRIYSSIGIRFIFSLSPLLIYLFFMPSKDIYFIISYLFLYFFYTAFEIYFLVANLRPDSKKQPTHAKFQ
jgi:hypothetical protein